MNSSDMNRQAPIGSIDGGRPRRLSTEHAEDEPTGDTNTHIHDNDMRRDDTDTQTTMRRIRFRGRDKCGKWHHGDLTTWRGGAVRIRALLAEDSNGTLAATYAQVSPNTVGQSTGITDDQGREIYEGDVLRVGEEPAPAVVSWRGAGFGFSFPWRQADGPRNWEPLATAGDIHPLYHILGNVHDNPEYLA